MKGLPLMISPIGPGNRPLVFGSIAPQTPISPAAWRHILLNGHYTFNSEGKLIDLDIMIEGMDLE